MSWEPPSTPAQPEPGRTSAGAPPWLGIVLGALAVVLIASVGVRLFGGDDESDASGSDADVTLPATGSDGEDVVEFESGTTIGAETNVGSGDADGDSGDGTNGDGESGADGNGADVDGDGTADGDAANNGDGADGTTGGDADGDTGDGTEGDTSGDDASGDDGNASGESDAAEGADTSTTTSTDATTTTTTTTTAATTTTVADATGDDGEAEGATVGEGADADDPDAETTTTTRPGEREATDAEVAAISVSGLVVSPGKTGPGLPLDNAVSGSQRAAFGADTEAVCMFWKAEEMPSGVRAGVEWVVNGSRLVRWEQTAGLWLGESSARPNWCVTNPAGGPLQAGAHEVTYVVQGRELFTATFGIAAD